MKELIVSLLVVAFVSCTSVEPVPVLPRTLVVLVDISGSTNTPAMKALYVNAFSDALRTVRHGDAVVVSFITDKSVSELELPVNVLFADRAINSDNSLLEKGSRIAADSSLVVRKKALVAKFDSLISPRGRRIQRTDIISSLGAAERCFKSYGHTRRTLLVLSDMIETSGERNFLRDSMTEARRSQIIRSLERQRRLADLNDVHVFVVGASAPDVKRYYEIRDFWIELFTATGARILPEQYGSSLVRINAGG